MTILSSLCDYSAFKLSTKILKSKKKTFSFFTGKENVSFFINYLSVTAVYALPPHSPPFPNSIIHTVLHGHNLLKRHTFEYGHFHLVFNPEEGVNTKHQEGNAGYQPDHVPLYRICRNIQNHIYCSTDSDNWEKRTAGNLKGARCLWKSFSQNQYVNMSQYVRDHPENRANQDQEGNGI